MRIAIIPARGGSKRIPRKNVRPFRGKPMIVWSIEAAIASGCFDRILVSTDDEQIAGVAVRSGAEAPFRRPPELADDHTGTEPVIAHALGWLAASRLFPDPVCCIYPTVPFLAAADLREGLTLLQARRVDYAFSATTYDYPIHRALRIAASGCVEMIRPEYMEARSQDLPEAIHDAGQFYWGRADAFAAMKPLLGSGSCPLILPRYRVQDIDTPEDWRRAEVMHQALEMLGTEPARG